MIETNKIHLGDCREILSSLPENSVDAIVTDPPYGLGFMGVGWDTFEGRKGDKGKNRAQDFDVLRSHEHARKASEQAHIRRKNNICLYDFSLGWAESCFRVLKPGGHLLAFGGTRTCHRITCAIEDAGFEIRDQMQWLYGSGLPKSLDVSKAIDKAAGAAREVIGEKNVGLDMRGNNFSRDNGKRKISDITIPSTDSAKQWQGWGTALKPAHEPICLARKPLSEKTVAANMLKWGTGALNIDISRIGKGLGGSRDGEASKNRDYTNRGVTRFQGKPGPRGGDAKGRWPANIILDEEAGEGHEWSRFFYCAKASKKERGEGNTHPTVKPLALMSYLINLITPKGGIVLDPFSGSGSTLIAAKALGFDWIGTELSPGYRDIALSRLASTGRDGGQEDLFR